MISKGGIYTCMIPAFNLVWRLPGLQLRNYHDLSWTLFQVYTSPNAKCKKKSVISYISKHSAIHLYYVSSNIKFYAFFCRGTWAWQPLTWGILYLIFFPFIGVYFVLFEFSAEGEGGFWLYRSVTKSHKKGEKDKKPPSRVTIPVSVFRKMIVSI